MLQECRVERHCSRKDGTASFSVGLAFKCRGVAGKVVGNDILRRQTRVFGPFRAPRIWPYENVVGHDISLAWLILLFSCVSLLVSLLWPLTFSFLSIRSIFLHLGPNELHLQN